MVGRLLCCHTRQTDHNSYQQSRNLMQLRKKRIPEKRGVRVVDEACPHCFPMAHAIYSCDLPGLPVGTALRFVRCDYRHSVCCLMLLQLWGLNGVIQWSDSWASWQGTYRSKDVSSNFEFFRTFGGKLDELFYSIRTCIFFIRTCTPTYFLYPCVSFFSIQPFNRSYSQLTFFNFFS